MLISMIRSTSTKLNVLLLLYCVLPGTIYRRGCGIGLVRYLVDTRSV